jgi:hypothetical protein
MAEKSLVRRIHDATCPGAVADLKPVQKVCPVCRSAAPEEPDSTD